MWITIILAVLLCLSAGCCIYQKRKTYRMIDRLLDSVLSRETVVHSDVEEGEYSALVIYWEEERSNRGRGKNSPVRCTDRWRG